MLTDNNNVDGTQDSQHSVLKSSLETQCEVSQLWQSVRRPHQSVIQIPVSTVDQLQLY